VLTVTTLQTRQFVGKVLTVTTLQTRQFVGCRVYFVFMMICYILYEMNDNVYIIKVVLQKKT
jgi:hypothetical protein